MKSSDKNKVGGKIAKYLFWGVCTTAVNVGVFWIARNFLHLPVMVSNILAWVLSVTFAYVANRSFVFEHKAPLKRYKAVFTEIVLFTGSRLFSGGLDMLLVYMLISASGYPEMTMKVVINVIVVVINYISARYLVFRRRA